MLKLYENIKKRRTELNISQQELAELVGYKGKSNTPGQTSAAVYGVQGGTGV